MSMVVIIGVNSGQNRWQVVPRGESYLAGYEFEVTVKSIGIALKKVN